MLSICTISVWEVWIFMINTVWTYILEIEEENGHGLYIEEENQKIGTYDMAKSLAKYYLKKGAKTRYKKHKIIQIPLHRLCNVCKRETYMLCVNCNEFFCLKQTCFGDEHSVTIHTSRSHESKLECSIRNCDNRTKKFCEQCNMHICTECFDGGEHTIIQ